MSESRGLTSRGLDPNALALWAGGVWRGAPGIITGVSNDTRTLQPGDLFFALQGEGGDGHDFAAAALAAGASGAVVAAGRIKSPPDGALLEVDDPRAALGRMASGYRGVLDPFIVGVTGSVGKTTVKEMIAAVLGAQAPVARTRGNWNNDIGLPLSLLAMKPVSKIGVFEIGMSHPGELAPLCGLLKPDWGVVTRIGPVHLEFFDSIEAIAAEKAVLLQNLPDDGIAFLNIGDPYYQILRKSARARVATVGIGAEADYSATIFDKNGRMAVKERDGEIWEAQLPLAGRHNAENALFACALGRERGIEPASIQAALSGVQSQPMRWEVSRLDDVRIINDAYNANPLSMRAALAAFADEPVAGGRWLVLAGMRELGRFEVEAHEALGREVASGAWAGLITVGERGVLIANAARNAGMAPGKIMVCRDHAHAAKVLKKIIRSGDAALFKASRGERLEKIIALFRDTGKK